MSYLFHHNKNCYPLMSPTAPTPKSPGNWNQFQGNKAYRSFGKYPTRPHDSTVTRERKFWTLGSTSWAPILWRCDLISNLQSLLLWNEWILSQGSGEGQKGGDLKAFSTKPVSVNSSYVWRFLILQQGKFLYYSSKPSQLKSHLFCEACGSLQDRSPNLKYLFIWLPWALVVAHRILDLCCSVCVC